MATIDSGISLLFLSAAGGLVSVDLGDSAYPAASSSAPLIVGDAAMVEREKGVSALSRDLKGL